MVVNNHGVNKKLICSLADSCSPWGSVFSISTGPGPGLGPLRSNIASVRSRNIFQTTLDPCVAFAVVFVYLINYTSHQPQEKKIIDLTASIG